jgi:PBP1b-binding outer membrane lipoprotein LpoB
MSLQGKVKMKKILTVTLLTIFLAACSDDVPKVEDPHNVIVDGQKMMQADFLQKYCVGTELNETCARVKNAMAMDSTRSSSGIKRF